MDGRNEKKIVWNLYALQFFFPVALRALVFNVRKTNCFFNGFSRFFSSLLPFPTQLCTRDVHILKRIQCALCLRRTARLSARNKLKPV